MAISGETSKKAKAAQRQQRNKKRSVSSLAYRKLMAISNISIESVIAAKSLSRVAHGGAEKCGNGENQ
jgi:hypothetical protein